MSEEEPDEDEILEGADLCLCCLAPQRPGSALCVNCGAPQDFIACTLPFLRILAEGFVFERAVQSPRSWLTVAGIWVIFGQLALAGIGMLWWWFPTVVRWPDLETIALTVPSLANFVIGIVGIVSTTVNHIRYRRALSAGAGTRRPPTRSREE